MNELPTFKTVAEAMEAIHKDKLSNVIYSAKGVTVFTAFGTGTFKRDEWEKGKGFINSMVVK